jgi:hypothetical protein
VITQAADNPGRVAPKLALPINKCFGAKQQVSDEQMFGGNGQILGRDQRD